MSPLHHFGDLLRAAFGQIPLGAVRVVFVAIPLLLMVWVLRLPSREAVAPGPSPRWDADLRIWAWFALALQVIIYCAL